MTLEEIVTDLAWVQHLIETHPELAAMRHAIAVQDGRVSVEVHGSHRQAHAWRAAIGGSARILPHYDDVRGTRHQVVIGHGISVEVIEHPALGGEL